MIPAVQPVSNSAISSPPSDEIAALTLDNRAMICDCNRASEALFHYCRSELVNQHVSVLLPQLADPELIPDGQPSSRLRFLCHAGHQFHAVTQGGRRFASALFFNCLNGPGYGRVSLMVRPADGPSFDREKAN